MIRKITLTAAAAALAMGGIVAFAGPAGAGAKVPLGDAHGPLHCTAITAKVKFNPPLTNAATQPSVTSIKGKVGSCTGSLNGAPGAVVTKAKDTGSIVGNTPGTCSGLAQDGTAPVNLHTVWKASGATLNPSDTSFNGVGYEPPVGFRLPKLNGGTVTGTGSYSGQAVEIHAQASGVPDFSRCDPQNGKPAKGIKKLTIVSGTLNISA